ncbi:MAG TPA: hypothetical protein VMA13_02310 [Candidatus Saccharimonadales bacterium]|nr:hypothetical protein [Candidatus Saccharimonadales bacterium]
MKTIVISAAGYSQDTVVQSLTYIQSILTGVSLSGSNLAFSFTNVTGLSFSVLGTNKLTAPLATWPVVGSAIENPLGPGHFQSTAPNSVTNSAQFFYILRQP